MPVRDPAALPFHDASLRAAYARQEEGPLSEAAVEQLIESTEDGAGLSSTERGDLERLIERGEFDPAAKDRLQRFLAGGGEPTLPTSPGADPSGAVPTGTGMSPLDARVAAASGDGVARVTALFEPRTLDATTLAAALTALGPAEALDAEVKNALLGLFYRGPQNLTEEAEAKLIAYLEIPDAGAPALGPHEDFTPPTSLEPVTFETSLYSILDCELQVRREQGTNAREVTLRYYPREGDRATGLPARVVTLTHQGDGVYAATTDERRGERARFDATTGEFEWRSENRVRVGKGTHEHSCVASSETLLVGGAPIDREQPLELDLLDFISCDRTAHQRELFEGMRLEVRTQGERTWVGLMPAADDRRRAEVFSFDASDDGTFRLALADDVELTCDPSAPPDPRNPRDNEVRFAINGTPLDHWTQAHHRFTPYSSFEAAPLSLSDLDRDPFELRIRELERARFEGGEVITYRGGGRMWRSADGEISSIKEAHRRLEGDRRSEGAAAAYRRAAESRCRAPAYEYRIGYGPWTIPDWQIRRYFGPRSFWGPEVYKFLAGEPSIYSDLLPRIGCYGGCNVPREEEPRPMREVLSRAELFQDWAMEQFYLYYATGDAAVNFANLADVEAHGIDLEWLPTWYRRHVADSSLPPTFSAPGSEPPRPSEPEPFRPRWRHESFAGSFQPVGQRRTFADSHTPLAQAIRSGRSFVYTMAQAREIVAAIRAGEGRFDDYEELKRRLPRIEESSPPEVAAVLRKAVGLDGGMNALGPALIAGLPKGPFDFETTLVLQHPLAGYGDMELEVRVRGDNPGSFRIEARDGQNRRYATGGDYDWDDPVKVYLPYGELTYEGLLRPEVGELVLSKVRRRGEVVQGGHSYDGTFKFVVNQAFSLAELLSGRARDERFFVSHYDFTPDDPVCGVRAPALNVRGRG